MQPNTVESGTRLADRYRLEECLKAEDGFTTWRAVDEKLSRYVGVHILPSDHPRAKAVVQAAQSAAMLNEGRFSQVLDASQQGDTTYVVEERLRGSYLNALLAAGPLSQAESASMTREVAAALAAAHKAGLAHLRLHPENVLRTESGQVKVFGLAVEAALHGSESDDPARADARGLGAMLYACLTARWPDGADHGLAAAPYENGVLCSPRQVRAGVPAALDEIVMRALSETPLHGTMPLSTPAEVAAELATVRRLKHEVRDAPTEINPGIAAPTGLTGLPPARLSSPPPPPAPPGPSRTGRAISALVGLLVLAGVVLFAVSLVRNALDDNSGGDGTGGGQNTPAPKAGTTIQIASVKDFDPPGKNSNGEENPQDVKNVRDGKPDTVWETSGYNASSLPPYKPGVGLVLDLGEAKQVGTVTVALKGSGTTLELRAADESATSRPGQPDDYKSLGKKTNATGDAEFDARGTKTRFLLVWLTKVPPAEGGRFRGQIAEITVRT